MEERDDAAMRPVYEAGGGEAEGFEQAEADLVGNAEYTAGEGIPRLEERGREEAELDPATYGEADQEELPE